MISCFHFKTYYPVFSLLRGPPTSRSITSPRKVIVQVCLQETCEIQKCFLVNNMTHMSPNHAKNQVQGPHRQREAHIRVGSPGRKMCHLGAHLASHESISSFLKPESKKRATSPSAKFRQQKTDVAGFDVMGYKNDFIGS